MAGEISFGVNLTFSSNGTVIGKLLGAEPPCEDYGETETTYLGQSSRVKTFIPGMAEPGEFSAELIYESATNAMLAAMHGVPSNYSLVFTTGANFSFPAFVKSHPVKLGDSEALKTIDLSMKVTGPITKA